MTIDIKSIPHFSNCSLQDLAKLAPHMKEHLFENGDEIFNEGDRAETFFFIYLMPERKLSKSLNDAAIL